MNPEITPADTAHGHMLVHVHTHIVSELQQSSRTDTLFVVVAVLFNLVVLGINSSIAGSISDSTSDTLAADLVLGILFLITVLVNSFAILALQIGRRTRSTLLTGLMAMYHDNQVDRYYDKRLLMNYNRRYMLFAGVILCLAFSAIAIPLIVRFL